MIEQPGRKHKGKNQNDPARFIKTTNVTNDGETAERLIKKGKMTLEDIAECVPSLSFDELREIEAEVMQLA